MKKISTAHWLLVAILILRVLFFGITMLYARITGHALELPVWIMLLISQAFVILPFAIYCIATKSNPLKLIRFKKTKPVNVIMALLVMIFSYPVIVVLNLISMLFVDNAMAEVLPGVVSMGLPLGLLFMAAIPACVEETVFRGSIYNTYSRRKPLTGIFFSALLFGLMHMNFNQMPYAFFLGIILALMMEATDSIIIPMIMHFSLNGFTTLVSFMTDTSELTSQAESLDLKGLLTEAAREAYSGQNMSPEQIDKMVPVIIGIVIAIFAIIAVAALAIVLALIFATFKINRRKPKEVLLATYEESLYVENARGKMRKNRMIDLPVILFMLYCIGQCIFSALVL